jgi:hypothetical protein
MVACDKQKAHSCVFWVVDISHSCFSQPEISWVSRPRRAFDVQYIPLKENHESAVFLLSQMASCKIHGMIFLLFFNQCVTLFLALKNTINCLCINKAKLLHQGSSFVRYWSSIFSDAIVFVRDCLEWFFIDKWIWLDETRERRCQLRSVYDPRAHNLPKAQPFFKWEKSSMRKISNGYSEKITKEGRNPCCTSHSQSVKKLRTELSLGSAAFGNGIMTRIPLYRFRPSRVPGGTRTCVYNDCVTWSGSRVSFSFISSNRIDLFQSNI